MSGAAHWHMKAASGFHTHPNKVRLYQLLAAGVGAWGGQERAERRHFRESGWQVSGWARWDCPLSLRLDPNSHPNQSGVTGADPSSPILVAGALVRVRGQKSPYSELCSFHLLI